MTREMLLTDPEQAADFVKRTQLDALAIAIGTSHGAYKFTRKPTGDILAIDRIKQIHRRIPNTHLVMHGSSSVPQDLLEQIRQYARQTFVFANNDVGGNSVVNALQLADMFGDERRLALRKDHDACRELDSLRHTG